MTILSCSNLVQTFSATMGKQAPQYLEQARRARCGAYDRIKKRVLNSLAFYGLQRQHADDFTLFLELRDSGW